jgi:hypothetical protein
MKVINLNSGKLEQKVSQVEKANVGGRNFADEMFNKPLAPTSKPAAPPTPPSKFDKGMEQWRAKAQKIFNDFEACRSALQRSAGQCRQAIPGLKGLLSFNQMSEQLIGHKVLDEKTPDVFEKFAKDLDRWSSEIQQYQNRLFSHGQMNFKNTAPDQSLEEAAKLLKSKGWTVNPPAEQPAVAGDSPASAQPAAQKAQ